MPESPIRGRITFGGSSPIVRGRVTQRRAASGAGIPASVAGLITFVDPATDRLSAFTSPVRYTRTRLVYDGSEVRFTREGQLTYSESMKVGTFRTIGWKSIGELWSMPTIDTVPALPSPIPVVPGTPVLPAGRPPLVWGNLPVELYLSIGSNPLLTKETKLFQGFSYQKSNAGTVAIAGQLTAVDVSLKYAQTALCYELAPFAGKRRGTIVKELAAAVGIDPATVTTPLGEIVTKPILLSNGSLMQVLGPLLEVENLYPFFDENANLIVIPIEMKPFGQQDWILDYSKGDFDLDGFSEELPALAPSSYYLSAIGPVADSPDGTPNVTTTTDVQSVFALYNPLCVRTSGYLQSSGQYAVLPEQQLMEVLRTTTVITRTNGIETLRVFTTMAWYNPKSNDQNYNSVPPGTDYSQAYGDKSFHIWNAERFVEVEQVTTVNTLDGNGTVDNQTVTTKSWTFAKAGLLYRGPGRTNLTNAGGRYVYPGPTADGIGGVDPSESYQMSSRVTKQFIYGADGYLQRTVTDSFEFSSPQSRSDVPPSGTDGVPIIPPTPPPFGPPPPPPPPFAPVLPYLVATSSGPNWAKSVGTTIVFSVTVSAPPANKINCHGTIEAAAAGPGLTIIPGILGASGPTLVGPPLAMEMTPEGSVTFDVSFNIPRSAPPFSNTPVFGRPITYQVGPGAFVSTPVPGNPGATQTVIGNILFFRLADRPGGWPPK